ncbi:PREDICTED: zinc finger protein interacting with ribonucleoprotein K-like isoform X2 [Myotis davidii]|uniref:zinc finger protein interacting with ribonucleoprotein K-like isoform X2 n=1 Tax=Myotis davidii TaxID=225400 RepID=UPI0007673B7B|nr:PREDICTED: zinc finger protein interacting with ribonucleoprotein K-like isoform X2 [Myotis davidii]
MLEVFALISSVGCWHKRDDEEANSEQSVYVQGKSQIGAFKTAPATQKTHLCKWCFSVLKDILHLTELQAAYFNKKAFGTDTCLSDNCFSANPHQQQRDASGQKPWKEDMDRASLVSQCSFYLIRVPSTTREIGKDLPAISDILQHQDTFNTAEPHNGNEIPQEFLSGRGHDELGACEKAASHNQKVIQHQGVCSRKVNYECNKCGKAFREIFNLIHHRRVYTVEKPYEYSDHGKSVILRSKLIQQHQVHTGEKLYECHDCRKSFRQSSTITQHQKVHTGEKPYEL